MFYVTTQKKIRVTHESTKTYSNLSSNRILFKRR